MTEKGLETSAELLVDMIDCGCSDPVVKRGMMVILRGAELVALQNQRVDASLNLPSAADAIVQQAKLDRLIEALAVAIWATKGAVRIATMEEVDESRPAEDNDSAIGGSGAGVDQPAEPVSSTAGVEASGKPGGGDAALDQGNLSLHEAAASCGRESGAGVGSAVAAEVDTAAPHLDPALLGTWEPSAVNTLELKWKEAAHAG